MRRVHGSICPLSRGTRTMPAVTVLRDRRLFGRCRDIEEYRGMLEVDGATSAAERQSPLVLAAQRLVGRIEALVVEVAKLRADNASLRREVRDAVALLEVSRRRALQRSPERPGSLRDGHQAGSGAPAPWTCAEGPSHARRGDQRCGPRRPRQARRSDRVGDRRRDHLRGGSRRWTGGALPGGTRGRDDASRRGWPAPVPPRLAERRRSAHRASVHAGAVQPGSTGMSIRHVTERARPAAP